MKRIIVLLIMVCYSLGIKAQGMMLVMMDESQTNHLKAYGIAYKVLEMGGEVHWLLNYRGGSFAFPYSEVFKKECNTRNVKFEVVPTAKFANIQAEIQNPEVNMDDMKLQVAPRVAVYSPRENAQGAVVQPWDDAVTLALTYAEIPYTVLYDDEILTDDLAKYDWLHLHHEDFTGMYGKFYRTYSGAKWYRDQVAKMEQTAKRNGFAKVSQLKLAVVQRVKAWVASGGFMFAMCSAADTYDIALASQNTDICDAIYDGDPPASDYQSKMDYSQTFAFKNFSVIRDALMYEHSDIDASPITPPYRNVDEKIDFFTLFDFSAKWDPVPTMLCQNHTRTISAFMGQSTSYRKKFIKSSTLILGEFKAQDEARYIHGNFEKGTWTFYGGHDPEDYRHLVEDPATDLALHPNSPGYRLILNNILFPAAKKKKQKT
jgi:hypothetical protein